MRKCSYNNYVKNDNNHTYCPLCFALGSLDSDIKATRFVHIVGGQVNHIHICIASCDFMTCS